METLVVAQHQNQYYSKGRCQSTGGLIPSPSRGFKGINCRTFQSSTGVITSSGALPAFDTHPSRRGSSFYSEPANMISNPIPVSCKYHSRDETLFGDDMCLELWAGPTYSNSPPPSSLPIPKFSLLQKCCSSSEFQIPGTSFAMEIDNTATGVRTVMESPPSLPTSELSTSPTNDSFFSNAYATENLRRILHLDLSEN